MTFDSKSRGKIVPRTNVCYMHRNLKIRPCDYRFWRFDLHLRACFMEFINLLHILPLNPFSFCGIIRIWEKVYKMIINPDHRVIREWPLRQINTGNYSCRTNHLLLIRFARYCPHVTLLKRDALLGVDAIFPLCEGFFNPESFWSNNVMARSTKL